MNVLTLWSIYALEKFVLCLEWIFSIAHSSSIVILPGLGLVYDSSGSLFFYKMDLISLKLTSSSIEICWVTEESDLPSFFSLARFVFSINLDTRLLMSVYIPKFSKFSLEDLLLSQPSYWVKADALFFLIFLLARLMRLEVLFSLRMAFLFMSYLGN